MNNISNRKPAGMKWESWVDRALREAEERGDFKPAKGGKIKGLDKPYDPDWWLKDLIEREDLHAINSEGLELRRYVYAEIERIKSIKDRERIRQSLEKLNDYIRQENLKIIEGPASNITPVDVDHFLETID